MNDRAMIEDLLSKLTLEEKAELCSGKNFWELPGVERLGLPSIMVTDGPHGLRKQSEEPDHIGLNNSVPATCFPTASGLAATWNPQLIKEMGIALAHECRAEGVSVLLGPGLNIKRNPLGGRNFEYFSEDPYVSGEMASAWVEGLQSQGVGASAKHFAVNNHEFSRLVVDAIVDQRTLREIYLPGFEKCVKTQQPWTVMCAYNKVNGTYASENKNLMVDILQDEWGFQGAMVTDWGACNDRVLGVKHGQHLEMPYSGETHKNNIIKAVQDGTLSQTELDHSVAGVLGLILRAKEKIDSPLEFNVDEHHALAKKVAIQSCVLLKNDNNLLPLNQTSSIAVIGALAVEPRYQGSGSSQIIPTKLDNPLAEIQKMIDSQNVEHSPGYLLNGNEDATLLSQAIDLAKTCDKIVLVAGLPNEYESEGFDREHMDLPANQLALIEALEPYYHKLVIVLQNGAPVALPFAEKVPCILEAYLGGQAGASALAEILFGKENPSGKLAETFPVALKDVASSPWFPGTVRQSQYREGIWVGYRYFDTANIPAAFPFGHGLSYTQYEYSDITVSHNQENVFTKSDIVTVTFTVQNTGQMAGAEIAQLYVGQSNSSVPRPIKELKCFERVYLQPGEKKQVSMRLDYRAFAYWSVTENDWLVESDLFTIFVGASVADIRLNTDLELQTGVEVGVTKTGLDEYFNPSPEGFSTASFEALLGHSVPAPVSKNPVHINSTLVEIQDYWLGRLILNQAGKSMAKMMGLERAEDSPIISGMLNEMPLRSLISFSNGKFGLKLVSSLVHIMNKDWLKLVTLKIADRH